MRTIAIVLLVQVLSTCGARAADLWLPGDLHTHSAYSWDAAQIGGDSVARCLGLAARQGLAFESITDHQSVAAQGDPAFAGGRVTAIPGEEWGIMGHAGLQGVASAAPEVDTTRPPETWNAQVELSLTGARGRGGLVVVNHPSHPDIIWAWTTSTFDAVEVWNAGWVFPFQKPTTRAAADALLAKRGLAGVPGAMSRELSLALEVTSGGINAQAVRFWEAHLERGVHAAAVGGGDRHILIAPGYPTTWIRAADRSLPALLAGLRAGRTCVTRGPGFAAPEFSARQDDAVALPGDTLHAGRPVHLALHATVSGKALAVFYRGRDVIGTRPLSPAQRDAALDDLPAGPGWYRAEVLEPIVPLGLSAQDQALWDRLTAAMAASSPDDVLAFMQRFGEPIDDGGRLPSFRLPDKIDRLVNADPTHPGWCKSALTSAIYLR